MLAQPKLASSCRTSSKVKAEELVLTQVPEEYTRNNTKLTDSDMDIDL